MVIGLLKRATQDFHDFASLSSPYTLLSAPIGTSPTATSSYSCPMARATSLVQMISNPSDRRTGLLSGLRDGLHAVVYTGVVAGVRATAPAKMFDVASMPAFAAMPGTSMSSADIASRARHGGPHSLED
jgi:hypothetical protein